MHHKVNSFFHGFIPILYRVEKVDLVRVFKQEKSKIPYNSIRDKTLNKTNKRSLGHSSICWIFQSFEYGKKVDLKAKGEWNVDKSSCCFEIVFRIRV